MAEPLTGSQSHFPLPYEEGVVVLVQGSSSRSAAAAELSALPNLLLKPGALSSPSLGQKRVRLHVDNQATQWAWDVG